MDDESIRIAETGNANGQGNIVAPQPGPGHKRSLSGSILSKLSFLRASAENNQIPADQAPNSPEFNSGDDKNHTKKSNRAMAVAVQQQKSRRRRGSLRKAALLGRGAQREKKELKTSPLDSAYDGNIDPSDSDNPPSFGLAISDVTPRPSMDGYASRNNNILIPHPPIITMPMGTTEADHLVTSPTAATSPTLTYTSTTDEDDVLSIPTHNLPAPRIGPPPSSGSDSSYFPPAGGPSNSSSSGPGGLLTRRRSNQSQKTSLSKSPLSLPHPHSPPPLLNPSPDAEWDYSETAYWGWIILFSTWLIFVTGMGSCLGVWSWAWDVGETPYAPPELEDDPTLPIVGYYPALIILTSVMAWVWVVVAWVGMKYFRHAKISGD